MSNLVCDIRGHDPLPLFELQRCHCNPACIGEARVYAGTVCRRCNITLDPRPQQVIGL